KGRFRAWLFAIARNLALKFLSHRDRRQSGTGRTTIQELLEAQPASDPQAEAEFALEFRRRTFHWAAEQVRHEFTESTWQAFWKTGIDNRPVAAVAEELGISPGEVYIARSRVMARLGERVERVTEDSGLELRPGEDGWA